jgi:hypothetical protein
VVFLFFFFCLSEAAAWSAPPLVGCGSLSLYVDLRFWNQVCSPPAVLPWSWVFTVLDYWCLFLCFTPFVWSKLSDLSAGPPVGSMLRWFADYFSILQCPLSLDVPQWLRRWALWTTACPISGSGLSFACCQPFCLCSLCLLMWNSAPCSSSLLWCTFSNSTPLLCVSFQFLVYHSVFIFFFIVQFVQWAMLVYSRGGCGNTTWCLVLTCLVCWMSSKQVRCWHLVAEALLFSQCNSAWRSFPRVRGTGC